VALTFASYSKKFSVFSVPQGLRGSNDFRFGEKMTKFELFFFSVLGTGGRPMWPDPKNRVGDQDIGSPGRTVSSVLQVPNEPGHCRARTRSPW